MLSSEDELKIKESFENDDSKWLWIDIITNIGPTKLEEYFQELLGAKTLHHWSPTHPEGYIEIEMPRKAVIHWVLGEKNELVSIFGVEDVDFDEIDNSLSATIIQNSVIRIFSEKF
jgi:hypothetical protein